MHFGFLRSVTVVGGEVSGSLVDRRALLGLWRLSVVTKWAGRLSRRALA
jgi:hypothetical protein